jgi:hypothetical protein
MKNFVDEVENEIQLLICPYSFDAENSPDNLQLELSGFVSDNELKEDFSSVKRANYLRCYMTLSTAISYTLE